MSEMAIFRQLRAGLKRVQVQHGTHDSVTKDLLSSVLN